MQKTICRKTYDTAASTLIQKHTVGEWGDAEGYEESLYVTESGNYFLYVNGGAESKYPKEDIVRLSKVNAEAWRAEHC